MLPVSAFWLECDFECDAMKALLLPVFCLKAEASLSYAPTQKKAISL